MKKKVYLCAPMPKDTDCSLDDIRRYTRYALQCGVAPVAPHFFHLCMPKNARDRTETIRSAGLSLLWFCDEMWIFGDEVTDNMTAEIEFCKTLNIKTRKIRDCLLKKGIKP